MWSTNSLEEIENGSDGKHIVNVDVYDETGKRKVQHLPERRNTSSTSSYEVGNLEGSDVTELGANGSNKARLWLLLTRSEFSDALKRHDSAVFRQFNPRFEQFRDRCKVIQIFLFSNADCEITDNKYFNFMLIQSCDRCRFLENWRIYNIESIDSIDDDKVLYFLWMRFIFVVEFPCWSKIKIKNSKHDMTEKLKTSKQTSQIVNSNFHLHSRRRKLSKLALQSLQSWNPC